MKRGLGFALAAALCACAPAPVEMPAAQAAEVLERFAAGNPPADVCTPEGRAVLRGAVRSYGDAMAQAGETWPDFEAFGREPNGITGVEASVVIGVVSGFVEASDLRGPSRALAMDMTLANWPSVRDLRQAALVACPELVELQQAASRFVIEQDRYQQLAERARGHDTRAVEHLRRSADRMQRSMEDMRVLAEMVTRKVEQSRRAG
ncbi:MAG: hypothetical protein JNL81_11705 [Hyphomonadaceae bacterium]|nr:hypothetical protein [Hyphomonadaceae bacterium]